MSYLAMNHFNCCDSPDIHPKHSRPFSYEEACKMSASEMKKIWPRQQCKNCRCICYVSKAQYVIGDY